MIRMSAILFAAISMLTVPAQAEAERPALKRNAVITGDIVRIGDLVDNAGIVARIPIFRAPNLGETGTVSAASVIEAVRPHAIIGLDTRGITDIEVTRPARTITGKAMEADVAALLSQQYALGEAADLAIAFDRELHALNVEPGAGPTPRVLRISYDARNSRFDALLEFGASRAVRLTGTATPTVAVLVATRAVNRGELIRHSDVALERLPKSKVTRETLLAANAAVGFAAKQPLRLGQAIRSLDLMKPELVQRDASVTLTYTVPGITLTVRGKANEGGAEGDVISVTNLQTKRILQGVVAADGSVVVSPQRPRVVANLEPRDEQVAK